MIYSGVGQGPPTPGAGRSLTANSSGPVTARSLHHWALNDAICGRACPARRADAAGGALASDPCCRPLQLSVALRRTSERRTGHRTRLRTRRSLSAQSWPGAGHQSERGGGSGGISVDTHRDCPWRAIDDRGVRDIGNIREGRRPGGTPRCLRESPRRPSCLQRQNRS